MSRRRSAVAQSDRIGDQAEIGVGQDEDRIVAGKLERRRREPGGEVSEHAPPGLSRAGQDHSLDALGDGGARAATSSWSSCTRSDGSPAFLSRSISTAMGAVQPGAGLSSTALPAAKACSS